MTDTARMADIVLPATMFVEHDDIYQGGGHQHLLLGPKLMDAPGQCRSNHEVVSALARRLGAEHPGFEMSPRDLSGTDGLTVSRPSNRRTISPVSARRADASASEPTGRLFRA